MRHDFLEDDSIADWAKACTLLQERLRSVETLTVVTLVAKLALLKLEDSEDLVSFFIRRQLLLTLLVSREAVSKTLSKNLVLNDLQMVYESFVIQESFNQAKNLPELRERLQNILESAAQRHKVQSGSVALAVKLDFMKGPKRGNCILYGIPGHFATDCKRKETAQCSIFGEKRSPDRACKRQGVGGKHASVAIGPTLATTEEKYWAARVQWKPLGTLVDSGCTDYIVTNIAPFLDFLPIQSVVRNPNGDDSGVVGRGWVRISIPSSKRKFQSDLKTLLRVPDYSSNLVLVSRCMAWVHSFTFKKRNSCTKIQKGTWFKTNTRECFV